MSRLSSDPLFQGLTRPTTILGVTYMFFVVNAIICFVVFINMQSYIMLFVVFPSLHLIAYLVCLKEPRALDMLIVKLKQTFKHTCLNRRYHGNTNSYDLY